MALDGRRRRLALTLLLEAGDGLHGVAQRLGHTDAMVTATSFIASPKRLTWRVRAWTSACTSLFPGF